MHKPQTRNWQRAVKTGNAAWAEMYVSLNSKGEIRMSRGVFERLREPRAVEILCEPVNGTIGLKPTNPARPDAFKVVRDSKRSGLRQVNAYQAMLQFGLRVDETIQFRDVHIDQDNTLILDLRSARVPLRVKNHRNNKNRAPSPDAAG